MATSGYAILLRITYLLCLSVILFRIIDILILSHQPDAIMELYDEVEESERVAHDNLTCACVYIDIITPIQTKLVTWSLERAELRGVYMLYMSAYAFFSFSF